MDLERLLARTIQEGKTPGLQYVVVGPAATLFEYCGGAANLASGRLVRPDTTLMAYSMSKTITAAAVLQLVDAHAIKLDEPIARYLDWQPYGGAITVRHLLSHTSGIPNPIPLRWVHPAAEHATFDDQAVLRLIVKLHPRLAFAPGTNYRYSNIGYWLLGAIVERACDQPFVTYVMTRVVQALGIPSSEMAYTVADAGRHASGYLEKYSLMNLAKGWLIDRDLIGEYSGRWLRIRDHYPNGPAFGGLVGCAGGFGKFLQDSLRTHPLLFGPAARALFVEQQRTTAGPIPMTLGWHMGSTDTTRYLFKEGGGRGFHCMMRLYPDARIGTVMMLNATGANVASMLDAVDVVALRTLQPAAR